MRKLLRVLVTAGCSIMLAAPVVVADMKDGGAIGQPGRHTDDRIDGLPDRPATLPDAMQRNRPDPLDGDRPDPLDRDPAGDAPLDDDLDDRMHDDQLEDPLDEPANIPAPGM